MKSYDSYSLWSIYNSNCLRPSLPRGVNKKCHLPLQYILHTYPTSSLYTNLLKKKKGGGRYLPENWQVLLFHLFRLSLQGFSVYIDSQFSEINSKLTIGDFNWVVWKVAGDYRSVLKPGLYWHAILGKSFWLCQKLPVCTAAAWLCAAAGWCDFSMGRHSLVSCVYLANLGDGGTKDAMGWQQPRREKSIGYCSAYLCGWPEASASECSLALSTSAE